MAAYQLSGSSFTITNNGSTQTGSLNPDSINPITGGSGVKVVRMLTTGTANTTAVSFTPTHITYTFVNPFYQILVPPPGVPTGTGAEVTVECSYPDTYTVTLTNPGTLFNPGDILYILGSALGGVDTTNDLSIQVDTVDGNGAILTFFILAGTALWPQTTSGTVTLAGNSETFIQVTNTPADGCYFTSVAVDGLLNIAPVTLI